MYDGFLCTSRATKEGKNVKPAVIPSKSHSATVFIFICWVVLCLPWLGACVFAERGLEEH